MKGTHFSLNLQTNSKIDFDVNRLSEKSSILTSKNSDKSFEINLVREFRSGRSGDSVFMIKTQNNDNNSVKNYILKIFTPGDSAKQLKDEAEVVNQVEFTKLFKKITPCPKIHVYGTLTGIEPFTSVPKEFSSPSGYVIMELITPPYELNKYLNMICTGNKEKYSELYENVDIYTMILQLFYIISKMKLIFIFT